MNEIKALAKKLTAVGAKKNWLGKDLESIREIRDGLTQSLQTLKVCESCGTVVTEIARLELAGIRANVCKACGVKAFKTGALNVKKTPSRPAIKPERKKVEKNIPPVKKKIRKPVPHAENLSLFNEPSQPQSPTPEGFLPKSGITMPKMEPAAKRAAPVENGENGGLENDAVAQLGNKMNFKIGDLRKIIKSVNEMAIRMDLEQTCNYVMSEASQTGLKKLAPDEVKKMVKALAADKFIQVK
jgi:hypothetical protein